MHEALKSRSLETLKVCPWRPRSSTLECLALPPWIVHPAHDHLEEQTESTLGSEDVALTLPSHLGTTSQPSFPVSEEKKTCHEDCRRPAWRQNLTLGIQKH